MTETIYNINANNQSNLLFENDNLLKFMIKVFTKKLLINKNNNNSETKNIDKMYNQKEASSNYGNNMPSSTATKLSKPLSAAQSPKMIAAQFAESPPSTTTTTTSTPSKLKKFKKNYDTAELIRVEYYNDFNTCLSMSQSQQPTPTITKHLNNYDTANKFTTSINNSSTIITQQQILQPQQQQQQQQHQQPITQQQPTCGQKCFDKIDRTLKKFKCGNIDTFDGCKRRVSDFNDGPNMTVTCRGDGGGETVQRLDSSNQNVIKLERDASQSFGISIVGGKVNVSDDVWITGVFVKDIIPNSPADLSKQLKIGDRIVAIDDIDLGSSTHQQAVHLIRKAGKSITVLVESLKPKDNNSNLNDITSPLMPSKFDKKVPPPVTPSKSPIPEIIQDNQTNQTVDELGSDDDVNENVQQIVITNEKENDPPKLEKSKYSSDEEDDSDDDDDDDDEDSTELSGRTVTKAGKEIDRASAGNVKRSKEEIQLDKEKEDQFGYTTDKIKKKYGHFGHVFKCTIDRNQTQTNYIGLSLAGHKDRNKMASFVAGINPKGICAQSLMQVGDEILEVNGVMLHGRCHLNVSVIIRELPGNELVFIMLRRQSAKEDLATKPVRQFPTYNDIDDMFVNFKNVKLVKIRKGTQGLGIMIIEGRHSEAGQGIFISDIQEGSSAEQAGLAIGDMILAVNSETLLGCSYENAASLLKKSDGLITLRVCSPSKEKDNKENKLDPIEDNKSLRAATPENPKTPIKLPKTPVPDRSLSASPLPKCERSPAKEAIVNLATAPIVPNKDCEIEIIPGGKSLGVRVVGGANTFVPNGAVIVQVYTNGVADKDKRLQVFDQILEINGVKLVSTLSNEQIEKNIKQISQKLKMTVYRGDPSDLTNFTIDFIKKPGKSIGIEMAESLPHGVIVTDIIAGTPAAIDNRLQIGDIITHINNEDLRKLKSDECIAIMRAAQGSIQLKVARPAPKKR